LLGFCAEAGVGRLLKRAAAARREKELTVMVFESSVARNF
jgi:hypothetical protein